MRQISGNFYKNRKTLRLEPHGMRIAAPVPQLRPIVPPAAYCPANGPRAYHPFGWHTGNIRPGSLPTHLGVSTVKFFALGISIRKPIGTVPSGAPECAKFSTVNRADLVAGSMEVAGEASIANGRSLSRPARNTTVNRVLLSRLLPRRLGTASVGTIAAPTAVERLTWCRGPRGSAR